MGRFAKNELAAAPRRRYVHKFSIATWVANFYTVVLAGGGMVRGRCRGPRGPRDFGEEAAGSDAGWPRHSAADGSRCPGAMSAVCRGRARDGRRRIVELACLLLLAQHRHAGGWAIGNGGVDSPECRRHPWRREWRAKGSGIRHSPPQHPRVFSALGTWSRGEILAFARAKLSSCAEDDAVRCSLSSDCL